MFGSAHYLEPKSDPLCRHQFPFQRHTMVFLSTAYNMAGACVQAALSVKGWERLPREEIVTRACQAVAAVALEKRRNAELVHRLQQGHEEGLEARQLKGRYEELQALSACLSVPAYWSVCLSVCLSVWLGWLAGYM